MQKLPLSRVEKISRTMKTRKIDNLSGWCLVTETLRPFLVRSVLLLLVMQIKWIFIYRYTAITKLLFNKSPILMKVCHSNGVRISLYQKYISKRLDIPTGNKECLAYILPLWIDSNEDHLIRFLRGLYEAEEYLSIHLPTSTYNFGFVNTNPYLLKIVESALRRLEFHPEIRHNAIRIRKKAEVERLKNLLQFRQY